MLGSFLILLGSSFLTPSPQNNNNNEGDNAPQQQPNNNNNENPQGGVAANENHDPDINISDLDEYGMPMARDHATNEDLLRNKYQVCYS